MTDHAPPPQAAIFQLISGSWVAQALGAVARLAVADHLADGPKTSAELARAVGADTENLARTLRALAGVGLFTSPSPDSWALTPIGACLQTDAPGSMRYAAIAETDHAHWATWGRFVEAVRTGRPQALAALGSMPWDYYAKHPEDGVAFSKAMSSLSSISIGPVLASYDFTGAETIADIGGAHGALLAAVLRTRPSARGILFDLPQVVAGAGEAFGDASGRVERVGGDFLAQAVPSADLYLLKHVLHDWDDESCLKILRNVRAGMRSGARVLVIEMVIPEHLGAGPAPWMDLNMMVMLGAKERTAAAYGDLFAGAGLSTSRVIPTPSPYTIVEAVAS
jgi:O-methyltransferase/methyltransferase family protein